MAKIKKKSVTKSFMRKHNRLCAYRYFVSEDQWRDFLNNFFYENQKIDAPPHTEVCGFQRFRHNQQYRDSPVFLKFRKEYPQICSTLEEAIKNTGEFDEELIRLTYEAYRIMRGYLVNGEVEGKTFEGHVNVPWTLGVSGTRRVRA